MHPWYSILHRRPPTGLSWCTVARVGPGAHRKKSVAAESTAAFVCHAAGRVPAGPTVLSFPGGDSPRGRATLYDHPECDPNKTRWGGPNRVAWPDEGGPLTTPVNDDGDSGMV